MSFAAAYVKLSNSNRTRQSISLGPKDVKQLNHDEQVIAKFLQIKDIPPWHRGLSAFQTEAANRLLNALRDDTEQRTSHRVRACVSQIGIEPLISGSQTKYLMRLSRGNDLAFLWFLLEVHFKTPGPTYTLNEQLIMSAISLLDTMTTLRELDRLLPPGHPPLAEIERQKRIEARQRKLQELKAKQRRRIQNQPKNVSPYFMSLPRPRYYGKSLYLPAPGFKINLGIFEKHKNPHHIVHNEFNRWYAHYDLRPSRRIVNRILNEELTHMFQDFSATRLEAGMLEGETKGGTNKPMCGHHRDILALEESLKDKLRVIAHERCLKMLDLTTKKKEVVRNRIMGQLEEEIGKYVCKFHNIAQKYHRNCRIKILPNECTGYDLKLVEDTGDNDNELSDESCAAPRPSGLLEHYGSIDVDRDFRRESGGNIFMLSEKQTCPKKKKPCTTGICTSDREVIGKIDGEEHENDTEDEDEDERSSKSAEDLNDAPTKPPVKGRVSISNAPPTVCPAKSKSNYNYGHSESSTPTESQTYFDAPRNNNPYQFDYQKIFRFKSMVKRLNIKKTFVDALNSKMELSSNEPDEDRPQMQQQKTETSTSSQPAMMSSAISRCVCRIWKKQVAIKNIELEEEAERVRKVEEKKQKSPLNFEHKYYDPDDHALMLQMLKESMEYLAKNPKYVLASMPESYKLPILREWIAQRYGKLYSRKERFRSLQLSMKIFHALGKINVPVAMPTTKELGTNLSLNYACHDYLIKKAKQLQKEYYRRLNNVTMDHTRIFWFAMNPYLCSGGPPRNTYFAYMPSHITSIKRFRIWKTMEFMNAQLAWEQRVRRNRPPNF